jgi:hypothetical protein
VLDHKGEVSALVSGKRYINNDRLTKEPEEVPEGVVLQVCALRPGYTLWRAVHKPACPSCSAARTATNAAAVMAPLQMYRALHARPHNIFEVCRDFKLTTHLRTCKPSTWLLRR